ncbi:hypothetical protein AB1Y20_014389 [Prymnesium parvum]|uniref:Uncharacterized protein n=1 Tax=Prymnesium parvum TaxID=97485 RepID=A0AB34IHF9_PRYPA
MAPRHAAPLAALAAALSAGALSSPPPAPQQPICAASFSEVRSWASAGEAYFEMLLLVPDWLEGSAVDVQLVGDSFEVHNCWNVLGTRLDGDLGCVMKGRLVVDASSISYVGSHCFVPPPARVHLAHWTEGVKFRMRFIGAAVEAKQVTNARLTDQGVDWVEFTLDENREPDHANDGLGDFAIRGGGGYFSFRVDSGAASRPEDMELVLLDALLDASESRLAEEESLQEQAAATEAEGEEGEEAKEEAAARVEYAASLRDQVLSLRGASELSVEAVLASHTWLVQELHADLSCCPNAQRMLPHAEPTPRDAAAEWQEAARRLVAAKLVAECTLVVAMVGLLFCIFRHYASMASLAMKRALPWLVAFVDCRHAATSPEDNVSLTTGRVASPRTVVTRKKEGSRAKKSAKQPREREWVSLRQHESQPDVEHAVREHMSDRFTSRMSKMLGRTPRSSRR